VSLAAESLWIARIPGTKRVARHQFDRRCASGIHDRVGTAIMSNTKSDRLGKT
jgi:hypothetical protein